jgi:hypothetical protein
MATKNDKKKGSPSMTEYMMKRASMGSPATGTPPSGTPVYSREPRTASYQDSMMAYNKIKGKAAGAENLKPKGAPKKYVGMQPTKPKKK